MQSKDCNLEIPEKTQNPQGIQLLVIYVFFLLKNVCGLKIRVSN